MVAQMCLFMSCLEVKSLKDSQSHLPLLLLGKCPMDPGVNKSHPKLISGMFINGLV
jgi:hypothetical protein